MLWNTIEVGDVTNVDPSEITPEPLYLSRRKFLTLGAAAAGMFLLNGCDWGGSSLSPEGAEHCESATASAATDELGDALTPCESIINDNNFYEFTTDKEDMAPLARGFPTSP